MLETFFLLKDLPTELLTELKLHCPIKKFKSEELIIKEGDSSTEIYFPISGHLNYSKFDPELKQEIKFHELASGSGVSIGEMSFIDDSPRSCSIYAAADSEVLAYVLSFDDLAKKSEHASEIEAAIRHQVTVQIGNHLRDFNTQHIGALKDQINQLKERNFYGFLFIGLAAIISLTSLVNQVIKEVFPGYTIGATPTASWVFVILAVIPALLMMRTYKIPIHKLGISTHNLKKSLLDGVMFTAIIFGLVLGILWGIESIYPETQMFSKFTNVLGSISLLASLHYLPNSYLQEFVTRGMAQTAFQRFFSDERGYISVLVTSVFFGIGHIPFGLVAVAVTFVGGIVLGLIYLRTHNIIGVTLIHYFFGGVLFEAGML